MPISDWWFGWSKLAWEQTVKSVICQLAFIGYEAWTRCDNFGVWVKKTRLCLNCRGTQEVADGEDDAANEHWFVACPHPKICGNCMGYDHIAKACKNKPWCYNCSTLGHVQEMCWRPVFCDNGTLVTKHLEDRSKLIRVEIRPIYLGIPDASPLEHVGKVLKRQYKQNIQDYEQLMGSEIESAEAATVPELQTPKGKTENKGKGRAQGEEVAQGGKGPIGVPQMNAGEVSDSQQSAGGKELTQLVVKGGGRNGKLVEKPFVVGPAPKTSAGNDPCGLHNMGGEAGQQVTGDDAYYGARVQVARSRPGPYNKKLSHMTHELDFNDGKGMGGMMHIPGEGSSRGSTDPGGELHGPGRTRRQPGQQQKPSSSVTKEEKLD